MFSRSADRASPDDPRRGSQPITPGPGPAGAPSGAAVTDLTVIAREDRFEGTIRVHKLIRIAGWFKGRIEAPSVIIDQGGNVNAEVIADDVVVAGEYTGNLVCRKRLEVQQTGKVSGRLETLKLVLQEGAAMDGEIHMTKPALEDGSRPATLRVSADGPARPPSPAERGG
jgi:cytoskeletal protein CcmA (bactofilin family)